MKRRRLMSNRDQALLRHVALFAVRLRFVSILSFFSYAVVIGDGMSM